jgi:hypothetical protein
MNKKPQKLVLNQETLRDLMDEGSSQGKFFGTHNNCTAATVCSPFSCTLAPC